MIKIDLPRSDDPIEQIKATLKILSEIEILFDKKEKIILDFSETKWILPCSLILLSAKLKEISNQKLQMENILPKNKKVLKCLSDIGFPFGLGEGGQTSTPITHFANNPNDKNQINKEVNTLLEKMEDKTPHEFGDSIKYILGELTDNIDQHSNFSFASLMAQYFPNKKQLDIAIFDNGLTIPYVFEKNNIIFKEDSDAIKKAISGEVTTKKDEEMRGYGLKSCRRITTESMEGEFYIISRRGILIIKSNQKPRCYDIDTPLKGTFIYFRLKTPKKKIDIYPYVE